MILGETTRLRPIEKDDLPRFVKWFADPEVRNYLALYMPMSQGQEEQWFERNLAAGDLQAWAMDAQASDRAMAPWLHIGSCGYHTVDWRPRSGEVGIAIGAREYWGQGYGTDAMHTLICWGFNTLNLNRIYLRVFSDNARAIRCYEKVGFQLEGRLRQDNFHNGAYRDTLIMAMLREDWNKLDQPASIG